MIRFRFETSLVTLAALVAGQPGVARGEGLSSARNQLWHQDSPGIYGAAEPDDYFGSSLATGDFNGDGFMDLAIGVPSEHTGMEDDSFACDIGICDGGGAINVIYGTVNGLAEGGDQLWHPAGGAGTGVGPLPHFVKNDAAFAYSLASGDFNNDGYDDLLVGVPFADKSHNYGGWSNTIFGHGRFHTIPGSPTGLRSDGNQMFDPAPADGQTEWVLEIGYALAVGDLDADGYDDAVVGLPGTKKIGATWDDVVLTDFGAIEVYWGRPGEYSQGGYLANGYNSPGIETLETSSTLIDGANFPFEDDARFGEAVAIGDFNGDGRSDVAAGAPGFDSDSGMVIVYLSFDASEPFNPGNAWGGVQSWRQTGSAGAGTGDISGSSESGDEFGAALIAGDFDGDGYYDLAIGAPGENNDEGAVNILYGTSSGLTAARNVVLQQGTSLQADFLLGTPESGDRFGQSLSVGDFDGDGRDDLVVGAPGEDNDAGATHVILGDQGGLAAYYNQLWLQGDQGQGTDGAIAGVSESDDEFGYALATGDFNGDGRDDLAIGARYEDLVGGGGDAGAVSILYGDTPIDDTVEDNDSCATAVVLSPGNDSVTGLRSFDGDDDWFRVLVPGYSSFQVDLNFTHADGNIDLSLHDACGGTVLGTGTSFTDNESVAWVNTGPATEVFFRVYMSSNGGVNAYSMTLLLDRDALEQNNTCATATPVQSQPYRGLSVWHDDEDWYEVTVPANGTARFEVDYQTQQPAVGLELYDACNGNPIRTAGVTGGSLVVAAVVGPVDTTLYARVFVSSGAGRNNYDLTVFVDDDAVDNDSCATAQDVSEGVYSNLLVLDGDDDWYRVFAYASSNLTVSLDFMHGADNIDIEMWDACGGSLIAKGASHSNDESVSYLNTGPGAYVYVRVFMNYIDGRNTYDLNISSNGTLYGSDDCETATGITGDRAFHFVNIDATTDGAPHPLCDQFGNDTIESDVWFNWTSTLTGTATMTLCPDSTTVDTKIAVYRGSGCDGDLLACNDDACDTRSEVSFNATEGEVYKLRVGSFSPSNTGTGWFTMVVDDRHAGNTSCADAQDLSLGTHGHLVLPKEGQDWYRVYVPGNTRANIDLLADPSVQFTGPDLMVYRDNGCPGSVTSGEQSVPISGGLRWQTTVLGDGAYRYIHLRNTSNDAGVMYGLKMTTVAIEDHFEDNDSCAAAVPLAPATYNDLRVLDEDWYSVDVPEYARVSVSLAFSHAAGDANVQLLESCGSHVAASATNTDNELITYAHAGPAQTFLIRVYSLDPGPIPYNMTIAIETDLCDIARPIQGDGLFQFDNTNATMDGAPVACGGTIDIGHDVWFDWTAGIDGPVTVSTCNAGTSFDSMLAAYDGGDCGDPLLACNDDACDLQSEVNFVATAGQVYKLRIGTFSNLPGGAGGFRIDFDDVFAGNVNCATAADLTPGLYENLWSPAASSDWFRVFVPANTRLTAKALFDSPGTHGLWLYTGGCPGSPIGGYVPTAGGLANSTTMGETGEYVSVRFDNQAGPTAFALELTLSLADDHLEQNDTCTEPAPVTAGDYADLRYFDSDWYSIEVPTETTLNIDLAFLHTDGDLALGLYADCGTLITLSDSATNSETISFTNTGITTTCLVHVDSATGAGPVAYSMGLALAIIDCNSNGQPDATDIALSVSADCNANGIPDECEAFPLTLSANFTGAEDATFVGVPDDSFAGIGGQMVEYDFGDDRVLDGAGPDFNIYEVDYGTAEFNAIEVTVSANGTDFFSVTATEGPVVRIAGDDLHGDDAFARSYDLAGAGLAAVRYVRIDGAGTGAGGGTAGFDLDALGALYLELGACSVACAGDADGDGDVDISDLALVLSQFGLSGAGLAGDVDDDGDVDLSDLAQVLGQFGAICD